MSKGSKATREHIPASSDVGQRIGTSATRPWPITKIPYQALQGRGGACRTEGDTSFLAHLLAPAYEFQLFTCGATKQRLFRMRQPSLEVDKPLQVDLAYPILICQVYERRQIVQILFHRGEPEGDGRFIGPLFLLHGNEGTNVAPDLVKGVHTAHAGIG